MTSPYVIRGNVVSGGDVVNDVTYKNSVDTDRHVKHTKRYGYKTGHWYKV
jgi:hypothetical protein